MEVPGFTFGVTGPRFHFWGPGSPVPLEYFVVLGPGFDFGDRGSQVSPRLIITYKHGIYELPHELPNDLRLRILGNIRRVLKFIE